MLDDYIAYNLPHCPSSCLLVTYCVQIERKYKKPHQELLNKASVLTQANLYAITIFVNLSTGINNLENGYPPQH
jgi:hypothetical protein